MSCKHARGVTRKHSQSEVGHDGTTLDVGKDIVGDTPRHSGRCPVNARGVTRKLSQSEVG